MSLSRGRGVPVLGTLLCAMGGCGDDAGPNDAGPPPPDVVECTPEDVAGLREICAFPEGTLAVDSLCMDDAELSDLRSRIDTVVVVMQENRSFDHYFAHLSETHPEVEPLPSTFSNPDESGADVFPYPMESTCLPVDIPHQWQDMHDQWNGGAMDGFVRVAAQWHDTGHIAMGYYEEEDLPFYYWLARTFPISDAFFGSVLAGTWANRGFLYAGTSDGVRDTLERFIEARTVFDQLSEAGVSWGVYSDGLTRLDAFGWDDTHEGVARFTSGEDAFLTLLRDGTLPAVSFVDPGNGLDQDEHPPHDVQPGERWVRSIYEAARQSPQWPGMVIFFTYDESGGLFDHVPPPPACVPSRDDPEFDRMGFRVPFFVLSPWSRPGGFVSHVPREHASILRFIQLLHGLPALTLRDANVDVPLDMLDLSAPAFMDAPSAPEAGTGGCEDGT